MPDGRFALTMALLQDPASRSAKFSGKFIAFLCLLLGLSFATLLSWQHLAIEEPAMTMVGGLARAPMSQLWQGSAAHRVTGSHPHGSRSTGLMTAAFPPRLRAMSPVSYAERQGLQGNSWPSLESEFNGWMNAAQQRAQRFGPRGSSVKVNAEVRAAAGGPAPTTIVLGGDGFCGWPTALHLSENGHKVVIVDNLLRRQIDEELGTQSLTPICSPEERVQAWKEVADKDIEFVKLDVSDSLADMMSLFKKYKPDNIIHFAEIRAAPYSMKSPEKKQQTVQNNLMGVHNVLISMLQECPDAHLIHLGTMGVYGYNYDGTIPEGYLDVVVDGEEKKKTIVAPYDPGSVYHATKCLDNVLFNFYVKNDKLRITDLHQGVVWGVETPETIKDPRLVNRVDIDSDYGTVLNRFAVQAALGLDITPYGTGGQTRAFINIADTARCIRIATENPPARGDRVQIFQSDR